MFIFSVQDKYLMTGIVSKLVFQVVRWVTCIRSINSCI